MKKFLKAIRLYYERELATMQSFNAEFAAEFPAQAGQLGMEGGQGDDPPYRTVYPGHGTVERLHRQADR